MHCNGRQQDQSGPEYTADRIICVLGRKDCGHLSPLPAWNFGAIPFRSFAPMAREPDPAREPGSRLWWRPGNGPAGGLAADDLQHRPRDRDDPSPSASVPPTSYCDAQDVTIPGAAAFLAGTGAHPADLTAVQEAWLDMDATMVPACSEIVPDPPPVATRNLTNGELSSAAFQTWVTEDAEWLTLVEWAQQHGQAGLIAYLQGGAGNTLTSFVRAGGKVVDSQICEYPAKADAVSVTAEQMAALTDNISNTAGVVYVIAAVGPCTSMWTAGDGSGTDKGLSSGQEGIEVDVTSTATNPALGQLLIKNATWDRGDGTVSDGIMQQVGI